MIADHKETISVIVPTYNGAHKLPVILHALKKQTVRDFELLIVIDGSTDNTLSVLNDITRSYDDIKVIKQENRGRAAVRNAGAKRANGTLLVFFDDDMEPACDCLEKHIQHHQRHPNSLMSGGQVDDQEKARTSFQNFKVYLSCKWSKNLLDREDIPLSLDEMQLTAANFSIKKDVFFSLNCFDENLRDAEDFDLAVRAYLRGFQVYYNFNAFAWHNDFPTCASFIKRQIEYRQYHKNLIEAKPQIYSLIPKFIKNERSKPLMKRIFFSLWNKKWWIRMIDDEKLDFLPRKMKFLIYSWVVTGHAVYK